MCVCVYIYCVYACVYCICIDRFVCVCVSLCRCVAMHGTITHTTRLHGTLTRIETDRDTQTERARDTPPPPRRPPTPTRRHSSLLGTLSEQSCDTRLLGRDEFLFSIESPDRFETRFSRTGLASRGLPKPKIAAVRSEWICSFKGASIDLGSNRNRGRQSF